MEKKKVVTSISTSKKLSSKEKQILKNIGESVDFVSKYKKGRIKSKSFNQLLNELYVKNSGKD